ncbi:MAG TPA: hypothetical protein GX529_08915, partial [Firmicutes bacterium]|nr:hypothetical protein [Candidatus Fermentithermobacillaceae bacterium]
AVQRLVDEGFDHPTEFELNTALAFLYFAREGCDYVVLEVGMGGRFDATNVVTPEVSVITTIDFDHMDKLGNTLSEIAFEKAGIIKPGVPVVTGAIEQEALEVIKRRAEECGCGLTVVGKVPFADITWTEDSLFPKDEAQSFKQNIQTGIASGAAAGVGFEAASKIDVGAGSGAASEIGPWIGSGNGSGISSGTDSAIGSKISSGITPEIEGQCISISGPGFAYRNLSLPLLGSHQQLNAALAVAALKVAKVKPLAVTALAAENRRAYCEPCVGTLQCQASERQGRPNVSTHGKSRGIYLDEQGIRAGLAKTEWPGRLEVIHRNPIVILDGAHNPQGAGVLAEFLEKLSEKKIICVFGILSDKCYKVPTSYIAPLCDEMIITKPHTPRALDPEVLAQEARRYTPNVMIEKDSDRAVELALSKATSNHVVLCCGSLYLVGPARTFIRNKFGISPYGGE